MTKRHIVIATRESPLALAQTECIKKLLMHYHPALQVDFLRITTQADKRLDVLLTEIGGKGLFVKELEEALLDGRADMAVHSTKDVPMDLPPDLILPVMTKREEPRDVFVSNQYQSLAELPRGAIVGTSSLRRQNQLRAFRPDLEWRSLRGNINTRLARLDKGDYDAIILAAAGLKRLDLASRIKTYIPIDQCLPSAGQGALGIECRAGNEKILELIMPLKDQITYDCVMAERALCRRLGGGCKVPVAAYAEWQQGILDLRALVANRDGTRILHARREAEAKYADQLGTRLAEELLQQGAGKILKEFE